MPNLSISGVCESSPVLLKGDCTMASAISYVYVFFQAVAPLFICAICTGEGLCAGGKKPKLTVLFAVRGQEFHKDGYHITLEKSGKFYDLDGHVITDQQLKKDLLEASPGDPEDKRYIQFHV